MKRPIAREETKECPACGKQMIQTTGGKVKTVYPSKVELIWWCGCGHKQDAGYYQEESKDVLLGRLWQDINGL